MSLNQWSLHLLLRFTLSLIAIAMAAHAVADEKADRIIETVLLYQRDNGGWPKNYERDQKLSDDDKKRLASEKARDDTTFDNGATHREVRLLAKAYDEAKSDARRKQYKKACLAGVHFILKAQYPGGGWPQFYPESKGYSRHVTFNDGAMIGIMSVLRDVAAGTDEFAFTDAALRARAKTAVDKGIRCILDCQIEVDGKKTAWCAQHDAESLAPAKARSYELASISGGESAGVVKFLMEIDKPSDEVIEAIEGAIAWFEAAKLEGIRVVRKEDKSSPEGTDRIVVSDPSAEPMWARFYTIGTNKPIFCSRDGIPRATLAEISHERRNGYSWLGYYGANLLAKDYPAWRKKWGRRGKS